MLKQRHIQQARAKSSGKTVNTQSQKTRRPVIMAEEIAKQSKWGREVKEALSAVDPTFTELLQASAAARKEGGDIFKNPRHWRAIVALQDLGRKLEMGILKISRTGSGEPGIVLQGRWLRDAGFPPGASILVKVNTGGTIELSKAKPA